MILLLFFRLCFFQSLVRVWHALLNTCYWIHAIEYMLLNTYYWILNTEYWVLSGRKQKSSFKWKDTTLRYITRHCITRHDTTRNLNTEEEEKYYFPSASFFFLTPSLLIIPLWIYYTHTHHHRHNPPSIDSFIYQYTLIPTFIVSLIHWFIVWLID